MSVYCEDINAGSFADYLSVIWHGLPMDCSIAGYLTVIPALIIIGQLWTAGRWLVVIENVYFAIIALLLAVIFCLDLVLYRYWGFKLDMTPVFYFVSSPGLLWRVRHGMRHCAV